MGPVLRIILRYGIGVLFGAVASKGLVPKELTDQILADDNAITAIQTGLCVGAGVCVEGAYRLAKRRGWNL